jgi:hypothetical protein
MIRFNYLFSIFILHLIFVGTPGCATHSDRNLSPQDVDQKVIQAVRDYYMAEGRRPPDRIVIKQRSGTLWQVSVGPELKEGGLDVDIRKFKVVKYYPGF